MFIFVFSALDLCSYIVLYRKLGQETAFYDVETQGKFRHFRYNADTRALTGRGLNKYIYDMVLGWRLAFAKSNRHENSLPLHPHCVSDLFYVSLVAEARSVRAQEEWRMPLEVWRGRK